MSHSHETIGWIIEDNFVKDRMIDNSLIHTFTSSKIRRRTKALNVKIKKYCGVKHYKHYVQLKTSIVRNLVEDTDTDNSDNLSDTDYDLIYNSLNENLVDNSKRIFAEEDCKSSKRKINTKSKNTIKNTTASIPKKKSLQTKYNTKASEKRISIGWEKITKKNKDVSHLSNNQACTNNEKNKNNNCDYLKAQSLSLQFDSQNDVTSSIIKSVNEDMTENCVDSNKVVNESNSQDNTRSNKVKTGESEIQDYKEQNAMINKLDSQNSQNSLSKHHISSSELISSRNIDGSDNEISTVIKLENNNNSNKLAKVGNENLRKPKNNSNTYESQKSKLLKNVRRNLTSVLEEADLTNEDIEKNKNKEDTLNYDQLFASVTSSTPQNAPIKQTRINVSKNLSPDISSLDQQKDSKFDKDSQDIFDEIEQSDNISSLANPDAKNKPVSPLQFEKIDTVERITSENSKEDINNDNILEKKDNVEKKEFSREEEEEEDKKEKKFSREEEEAKDKKEKKFSREEEKRSSQLNLIDEDVNQKISLTNQENKKKFVKADEDIKKQQSLSLKKDDAKNVHSKSCDNILEEQNSREEESSDGKVRNPLQLNEVDKDAEIYPINHKDKNDLLNQSLCSSNKMHSTEPENSCNIQKQQNLPKITCSEIINKKFTIINKQNNNNIEKNDINFQEEMSKVEETDNNVSITLETDNEEDNANYISPETKKRLEQQARLNLVVDSDSSQSDDEYITTETLKKHDDNSDTNCSSEDTFKNDETNCEKTKTDISHDKDNSIHSKEGIPIPIKKEVNVNSPNIKEEIRKQADKTVLITSTYENNNSAENKNSLKNIQYCNGNVCNGQNENIEDVESFSLRVSEDNVSSINEESRSQFSGNKSSSLDKENLCDQSEHRISDCASDVGTRCKPKHEQKVSIKRSNVHLDISCHRPYNLQQLVENEELLVETIPAGFTLADLSEDDEAFILNVPNKVLQYNLQDQLLSLKEKTIKFGESKYRIVRRKVGTVSCVFATGKQRRPYKIVNIKDISTIIVRERLPHCSRKSDVSNSYDTVIYPESKSSKISNRQINISSKMLKVDCNKRKRRSSDFETKQSVTKKGRLKLIHS